MTDGLSTSAINGSPGVINSQQPVLETAFRFADCAAEFRKCRGRVINNQPGNGTFCSCALVKIMFFSIAAPQTEETDGCYFKDAFLPALTFQQIT